MIKLNNDTIRKAVELWLSEKEKCIIKFGHISKWNVSQVTNMSGLFEDKYMNLCFNDDISEWDVSNVTSMDRMFYGANEFNQPINAWNISSVTSMESMFNEARKFNQPLSDWNTGNVTNMSEMFGSAVSFNQSIETWDVSKVIDMSDMFSNARLFNKPLNNWDVSKVTDMSDMFSNAKSFNQPIGDWNVGNVANMSGMFSNAKSFNQPIGDWNVSNVTNMSRMFFKAQSFNQQTIKWNISNVAKMKYMFFDTLCNQNELDWNLLRTKNVEDNTTLEHVIDEPIIMWPITKNNEMVTIEATYHALVESSKYYDDYDEEWYKETTTIDSFYTYDGESRFDFDDLEKIFNVEPDFHYEEECGDEDDFYYNYCGITKDDDEFTRINKWLEYKHKFPLAKSKYEFGYD